MATTKLQIFENNPLTFCVAIGESDDRLDCAWFNPIVENKIDILRKNKRKDRKLVKLKSIAEVSGGKRLPKGTVIIESEANTIPYVRATDVKDLKVNLDTAIKIPKEIHKEIQNYQLKQDDVVITIVGTIGDVGILEEEVEVCDFTENVARIRVNNDAVLSRFILHFLDSEYGKMQTERFSVGSLQYKLSLRSCRNIEIYIPYNENGFDKNAQRNILDEAYKLFRKANIQRKRGDDLIRKAHSVVVEKLKIPLPDEKLGTHFTQELDSDPFARLDALFNNPIREKLISNLKKYSHKELEKLVKLQRKENISPADFYSLIELEQIDEKTGRIMFAQEVPELGSEKILLKSNSILVSKLQPEKGKIAIVPEKYDGSVGSSELVPLSLESTDVSLKYLWAVLRSDYVLKQWEYELTGSSRMRIGSTELKQTIIPIPDKKIQEDIVTDIDGIIAESDKILLEAKELFKKAKKKFITAVIS